jgi:hypothetical protein
MFAADIIRHTKIHKVLKWVFETQQNYPRDDEFSIRACSAKLLETF